MVKDVGGRVWLHNRVGKVSLISYAAMTSVAENLSDNFYCLVFVLGDGKLLLGKKKNGYGKRWVRKRPLEWT